MSKHQWIVILKYYWWKWVKDGLNCVNWKLKDLNGSNDKVWEFHSNNGGLIEGNNDNLGSNIIKILKIGIDL
jgi:hypothetical protein